jgi:outer membrane protein
MSRVSVQRGVAGLSAMFAVLMAAPVLAADFVKPAWAPGASKDWTVTIGVEGRMLPTFEGSDRYTFLPFPLFDLRQAGTAPKFRSARDGFGFGFIDTGRFRAGPSFKVKLPRRESDDSALRGLGNVDFTLEAGAFAEFWIVPWLRTRAELRQGFGGHHGVVGDLLADVVVPMTSQLTFSGGPRLTMASAAAVSPYFSVTAAQSAASGLPVYDAGGGIYSYGAGFQARYQWSPQWANSVFVEYARLASEAGDSPVVTLRGSRDQVQVGIGLTYSFDMRALW